MKCTGVALSGFGGLDQALGEDISRYAKIHGDMPRGRWQRPRMDLVETTYTNLNEAVHHVCKEADVLITWGGLSLDPFTEGIKLPIICVSHSSTVVRNRISGITHLVAVSESAKQFFANSREDDWPPVAVIPNGVEIDRVCPRRGRAWQRAQWGASPDDKILLYLGRQAMDKNPWAAVEVLEKLPPNYKLVMIGNQAFHPEKPMPRLADLVTKLDLDDRVKFLPPIPYVGDALAGADCLLHLSLREADSLVVKEAFLAGLPVVHTPVGAIPEMIAEFGQVGWPVSIRSILAPLEAKSSELGPGHFGRDPTTPVAMAVDIDEAAVQTQHAVTSDAAPIATKMRTIAWEHWTAPAMCNRWANYLEGVVASWE
jgi:glycosyltransferase involved in cell wall biosynthesis